MTAPWWSPKPAGRTHEVMLLCDCENVEFCRTEIYASDLRLLRAELEAERAARKAAA